MNKNKPRRPDDGEIDPLDALPLETDVTFQCQTCWEDNVAVIDTTAGQRQEFVLDCSACCNPNRIKVAIDDEGEIEIEVEPDHT